MSVPANLMLQQQQQQKKLPQQGVTPNPITSPLSNVSTPQNVGQNPFGVPLPDPNNFQATISPTVQAATNALMNTGQTQIDRMVQALGTQFGGGDIVSSPRDRAQALLASDLGQNLLSQVLGLQNTDQQAQVAQQWGERENLINQAINKSNLGQQLTSQEAQALEQAKTQQAIAQLQAGTQQNIATQGYQTQQYLANLANQQALNLAQIQAQQSPYQMLSMILGSQPLTVGQNTGQQASSQFQFGL